VAKKEMLAEWVLVGFSAEGWEGLDFGDLPIATARRYALFGANASGKSSFARLLDVIGYVTEEIPWLVHDGPKRLTEKLTEVEGGQDKQVAPARVTIKKPISRDYLQVWTSTAIAKNPEPVFFLQLEFVHEQLGQATVRIGYGADEQAESLEVCDLQFQLEGEEVEAHFSLSTRFLEFQDNPRRDHENLEVEQQTICAVSLDVRRISARIADLLIAGPHPCAKEKMLFDWGHRYEGMGVGVVRKNHFMIWNDASIGYGENLSLRDWQVEMLRDSVSRGRKFRDKLLTLPIPLNTFGENVQVEGLSEWPDDKLILLHNRAKSFVLELLKEAPLAPDHFGDEPLKSDLCSLLANLTEKQLQVGRGEISQLRESLSHHHNRDAAGRLEASLRERNFALLLAGLLLPPLRLGVVLTDHRDGRTSSDDWQFRITGAPRDADANPHEWSTSEVLLRGGLGVGVWGANAEFGGFRAEVKEAKIGHKRSTTIKIHDMATDQARSPQEVGRGVTWAIGIKQRLLSDPPPHYFEHPENYLHPRAAADLGEYIVAKTPFCVLETHSEAILLRLQKLVRRGDLHHRDVAILVFERRQNEDKTATCHVQPVPLSGNGDLSVPFPDGFAEYYWDEMGV
jgi:hypothetical protein